MCKMQYKERQYRTRSKCYAAFYLVPVLGMLLHLVVLFSWNRFERHISGIYTNADDLTTHDLAKSFQALFHTMKQMILSGAECTHQKYWNKTKSVTQTLWDWDVSKWMLSMNTLLIPTLLLPLAEMISDNSIAEYQFECAINWFRWTQAWNQHHQQVFTSAPFRSMFSIFSLIGMFSFCIFLFSNYMNVRAFSAMVHSTKPPS